MTTSTLTTLTDRVQRISHCGMFVDLVRTQRGTVRVGSMPDISKFLEEHGFREEYVLVPDWEVSLAGDNRTGEEFVQWCSQVKGGIVKQYIGERSNVGQLHHQLEHIFPYFFDEKRLSIVKKRWLANWFQPNHVNPHYRHKDMEIRCTKGNFIILDNKTVIYDRFELASAKSPDEEIESMLSSVQPDKESRSCLEIIPIGCGNGFHGTAANIIVRFGKYVIWIDPCGYPAHILARENVHWDDVTHFLITHNHEDHVQGFTACMHRAHIRKRQINLLTTKSVFRVLEKLYSPLFPNLKDHVNFLSLVPGTPLHLGPIAIESRWNHHILPYGTIGLKISAGGKSFGYSGDTKYDEALNAILRRSELDAWWFAPCDLVFHEIEFDNPYSVHTHWKQVEALQRSLPGKVLGYHAPNLQNSPFALAREGVRYLL